jgi:hypothetical protein
MNLNKRKFLFAGIGGASTIFGVVRAQARFPEDGVPVGEIFGYSAEDCRDSGHEIDYMSGHLCAFENAEGKTRYRVYSDEFYSEDEASDRCIQKDGSNHRISTVTRGYEVCDKVICNELNRQGYIPASDVRLCYHDAMTRLSGKHMAGYLAWGPMMVKAMRRSPIVTRIWHRLFLMRLRYIKAVSHGETPDLTSALVTLTGESICLAIGCVLVVSDRRASAADATVRSP